VKKRDAIKRKAPHYDMRPPKAKILITETRIDVADCRNEDDDGDDDIDYDDDDAVSLPPKLKGQHGIQLLADLDRSCLKEVDGKRMILGLIVQATFVCIIH
jgi:hypothetical protein